MQLIVSLLIVAAVVQTAVGVSTVLTGYVITTASYYQDSKCSVSSGSLTSLTYSPVGACIQTAPTASMMFSANAAGNVFLDTWTASATCAGTATTATVQQTTTTCSSAGMVANVYSATIPTVTGGYKSTATYAGPTVTSCTGTATSVKVRPYISPCRSHRSFINPHLRPYPTPSNPTPPVPFSLSRRGSCLPWSHS